MEKIYLDYAATSPVDDDVVKAMMPYFKDKFGNPSSTHSFGQEAQFAVDDARRNIAGFLGCLSQEVIFTGSATAANNLAITGLVKNLYYKEKKHRHIIISPLEHESVLEPVRYLEKSGYVTVTDLPVSKEGLVSPKDVKNAITGDTVLVSVIYANNEIGTIQSIKEIADGIKGCRNSNKERFPIFHTDAVQAANFLDMNVTNLGVDMLTISGHKIYGPKGIGVLYVKKGIGLHPLILGSGQEYGKHSGTENVPYIVGIEKALLNVKKYTSTAKSIQQLRDYFLNELLQKIAIASVNGSAEYRLPNNANILFKGINAADLIMMLDMEGIAVSAGSACQSKAFSYSHVLGAIGLSEKDAKASIRFSLGKYTTKKDIDRTIDVLVKLISKLK